MKLSSEQQLEEWMVRVAAGDRAAFDRLYEATVGRVLAFARRVLHDEDAAEDCAAETYIRVWRDARQYTAERGCVLAWIYTICRSRALDQMRAGRRQARLGDAWARETADEVAHGPETLLSAIDSEALVHPLLKLLSDEQLRLVGLAFFNGLSHAEIADATGMPLGTVKSHLHRAVSVMRRALGTTDQCREGVAHA